MTSIFPENFFDFLDFFWAHLEVCSQRTTRLLVDFIIIIINWLIININISLSSSSPSEAGPHYPPHHHCGSKVLSGTPINNFCNHRHHQSKDFCNHHHHQSIDFHSHHHHHNFLPSNCHLHHHHNCTMHIKLYTAVLRSNLPNVLVKWAQYRYRNS